MIPYGKQDISQQDIDAVVDVLRSDFLTQGPVVPEFEQAVKRKCIAEHAVAVNSATSALHIACLALGLGKGGLLWTSPVSFVASANCAVYCGAMVDFVDIDPATYNMSHQKLAEKLEQTKASGNKLPDIVIPVHMAGQSCDMEKIHELSIVYGFRVIEDASHGIGGLYKGLPIGSCQFSDITVFSFHPVKIITTGEGGMALTNDAGLANKMELLRSHGITRNPEQMTHRSEGSWYYQQVALGFNYRMTDLQAALGLSQLERLDYYVARRHELAAGYGSALAELPVVLPFQLADAYSAFHLYIIQLRLDETGLTRKAVFESLRASGIGVNVHYIPIHTQPYYQSLGFCYGDFKVAEAYYQQALSLPLFPTMTDQQQAEVVAALNGIFNP